MTIDIWYAAAFGLLVAFTTWACTRIGRNGGSTGTPHWNAATSTPIEFGRSSIAPIANDPPPMPSWVPPRSEARWELREETSGSRRFVMIGPDGKEIASAFVCDERDARKGGGQ